MKRFMYKLTWANLVARPLPTFLTIATLASAVALISIMMQFSNHTSERLERDLAGVDLVVGAKGSPLQLILSSLIHVDIPTGNIPLSEAQAIMKAPLTKMSVPLALGDSFRGFRIVGTNEKYLDLYQANLAEGRIWEKSQQVVIGSEVSRQLDMQMGQQFVGAHGLSFSGEDLHTHDHVIYEVVGILEPQASIIDQLILTPVDSVWDAHAGHAADDHEHDHEGHDHEGHDHEEGPHNHEEHDHGEDAHDHDHEGHDHDHDSAALANLETMPPGNQEITALLVQYSSPIAAVSMPREINERSGLQAAAPATEIARLYNLSSGLTDAAKLLAIIMTFIGGLSIFVAFSNAAVHKVYDIALLRAMGAKPRDVFIQQIFEGIIASFFSGVLGIGLAHSLLVIAAATYDPLAVFGLNGSVFYSNELYLLFGTILVGVAAAVWPAVNSYRIDPMLLLKGGR